MASLIFHADAYLGSGERYAYYGMDRYCGIWQKVVPVACTQAYADYFPELGR